MSTPQEKPSDPNFGSGPTAKPPGYTLDALKEAPLGRSHRSALCKERINRSVKQCRELLQLPEEYFLGIVPGSDTGAMELAMWNFLGPRPVDVCCWDAFGRGWLEDATTQLKLDVRTLEAPYGQISDLASVNPEHDVIFTWNGTTSGVKVPNADWISAERAGLVLCDATSAVFAMQMPWHKLDVVTFSWQKVLGGEAAHGMLILSPRAVQRLESHVPAWPIPKLFRISSKGKFNKSIFTDGDVINTISMLCIEDLLVALKWAEGVGSEALIANSKANLEVLEEFVETRPWIQFLAADHSIRSHTSVCFVLPSLDAPRIKAISALLSREGVAHDIDSYRDAPPGLRLWCGPNVQTSNLRLLLPWLDWAYEQVAAGL